MLRDLLGTRIGKAIPFHPAECLDALPHGATREDEEFEASLDGLREKLESLFEGFTHGGLTFGVRWINIDQAHDLRKTHGAAAGDAMLKKWNTCWCRVCPPRRSRHRAGQRPDAEAEGKA